VSAIPWVAAASAGDAALVKPLRSAIGAVARAIRAGAHPACPRVPPVSRGWLRQHAAEQDKHTGDL